jgi:hypothetical protein
MKTNTVHNNDNKNYTAMIMQCIDPLTCMLSHKTQACADFGHLQIIICQVRHSHRLHVWNC